MKRLLVLAAVLVSSVWFVGASCKPKPPEPTPTPTPTPGVPEKGTPQGPERLLRTTPDARVRTNDGQPFDMVMAVQCCQTFRVGGVETNSLWPLASEAWMDYTRERGAANTFHFRLGPFYADADTEVEWQEYGAPYLTPGGEWNPAFWTKVRELAWHAYEAGSYVEVVPIDSWGCKYSQWGNRYVQWPSAAISSCGRTWHPEHERYARKVVEELGCFGNVFWALDNEGEGIDGEQDAWFLKLHEVIRDEEQKSGCGFVHIAGSSVRGVRELVDYAITHRREPLTAPIAGRWTISNERNPAYIPEQEATYFAQARQRGQVWAFWRAGMNDAAFEDTLARFKAVVNGAPAQGCFPPASEDPGWGQPIDASQRPCRMCSVIDGVKSAMGNPCGKDPSTSLEEFASELRLLGYCAGKASDAVLIKAPDGLWSEHHIFAYTDGCYTQTSRGYKGAWKYNG